MMESPKKLPACHAGPLLLPSEAAGGAGQGSRLLHPVAGVAQGPEECRVGDRCSPGGQVVLTFYTVAEFAFTVFSPSVFHYSRTNPGHLALVDTLRVVGPW